MRFIANDIYTFGMLKLICFPLKNTLVFTMHCHTLSAYYIYSKDRHSKQKEGRKEKEKERKWKQEERKRERKIHRFLSIFLCMCLLSLCAFLYMH